MGEKCKPIKKKEVMLRSIRDETRKYSIIDDLAYVFPLERRIFLGCLDKRWNVALLIFPRVCLLLKIEESGSDFRKKKIFPPPSQGNPKVVGEFLLESDGA